MKHVSVPPSIERRHRATHLQTRYLDGRSLSITQSTDTRRCMVIYMHRRMHAALGYLTPAGFESKGRQERSHERELEQSAPRVSILMRSVQSFDNWRSAHNLRIRSHTRGGAHARRFFNNSACLFAYRGVHSHKSHKRADAPDSLFCITQLVSISLCVSVSDVAHRCGSPLSQPSP